MMTVRCRRRSHGPSSALSNVSIAIALSRPGGFPSPGDGSFRGKVCGSDGTGEAGVEGTSFPLRFKWEAAAAAA